MDNLNKNTASQEQEIDLIELVKKLWVEKLFILKYCILGFVVAIIVAFSIPKEYKTIAILAPEGNSNNLSGIGPLAAMAGISLGNSNNKDILYTPELFPSIIESTPFLTGLFDLRVKDYEQKIDTTFYSYIADYQKKAWWSYIFEAPFKLLAVIKGSGETGEVAIPQGGVALSKNQQKVIDNLIKRINVDIGVKTGIVTLSSTMQSPEISAFIIDTVTVYLQEYIIQFRTEKSRKDLLFAENLYNEARENYFDAQQNYAVFLDGNMSIVSAQFKVTQERLQNEMALTYNIYNQMAQQLQLAKVKVQDNTPVYTVVQPAVLPLKPSGPRKIFILFGFVFLAGVMSSMWIISKNFLKKNSL